MIYSQLDLFRAHLSVVGLLRIVRNGTRIFSNTIELWTIKISWLISSVNRQLSSIDRRKSLLFMCVPFFFELHCFYFVCNDKQSTSIAVASRSFPSTSWRWHSEKRERCYILLSSVVRLFFCQYFWMIHNPHFFHLYRHLLIYQR